MPVNRTGVHAGTATDAVQRPDMVGVRENAASSVVYDNDMVFTSFARRTIMRRVGRDGLTCSRTCQ